MTSTKLVMAGSAGFIAKQAVPAIRASTAPKFDATILTRENGG